MTFSWPEYVKKPVDIDVLAHGGARCALQHMGIGLSQVKPTGSRFGWFWSKSESWSGEITKLLSVQISIETAWNDDGC